MNWLYGIAALAVGLIVAFLAVPEKSRPILVFSAAVIAGAAGLTTAANNIDSRVAQGRQARVLAALAFFDKWNTPTFFHCRKAGREIIEYFRTTSSASDQVAYVHQDKTRLANLIDVLNTFEALSIAVCNDVVDEETARLFFRSIVVEYWHATEGFIRKRRAERNNARLYREFEALFLRWKD